MPDGFFHLGMALHILGLLLLYLAGAPAIRAGRRVWLENHPLPAPHELPPLALIIPLTGDSPAMRQSLASLLNQPGVDFQALLAVRDEADPAAALVRELAARFPHARLVIAGEATKCCQKNHSLLAGIKAAGGTPEILIFCDSTHDASPDFLTRLTAPLVRGGAVLSTSYHRVLPDDLGLPSLFHFFSAQFIHLLQNLPWFRLPWGGATAIRRDAFLRHGVDAIWARGVVDDFTMGPYLQDRGVRAAGVPEAALLTRLGRQSLGGWWSWWFRQLLYLKFCMPGTWLAATLAPLAGGALLWFTLRDVLSGGFVGWLYLGGLCGLGVLYGGLCQRKLPVWRAGLGFLAMQILTVPCFLATWFTNTLRWRGIAYRARLDGTVAAILRTARD
jgi:ceramide glucosyltransferase